MGSGLTRQEIDRARRTAMTLGGWNPVSSLALCDEIHRLHDVLESVRGALKVGHPSGAEVLLRAESDPAWGEPIRDGPDEEAPEPSIVE